MPKFEIHFHDKVGAQIAYVENFNATFDKDMNMQVLDANGAISKALNDLYADKDDAPKVSFISAVVGAAKAAAVITLLRQLMEGKQKPKDVLMPVRAAMDAGAIRRPTWEEFCQEFGTGRVKNKSSFSDYTNPDKSPYIGADFEAMKSQFRQLMAEGQ